jgi:hypothetical protein
MERRLRAPRVTLDGRFVQAERVSDYRSKQRRQTDSGIGMTQFPNQDGVFQADSQHARMKIIPLNFRLPGVIRVVPC